MSFFKSRLSLKICPSTIEHLLQPSFFNRIFYFTIEHLLNKEKDNSNTDHHLQSKDKDKDNSNLLHFQRGSINHFTFEGPTIGKLQALWIGLESGQWRPAGVTVICWSKTPLKENESYNYIIFSNTISWQTTFY